MEKIKNVSFLQCDFLDLKGTKEKIIKFFKRKIRRNYFRYGS